MKYIFLMMTFMLATIASANADTTCAVNSPDGELNVRELTQNGPGKVTDKLKNGYTVTMRDFYFLRGQSWARVVDGKTKTRVVGWVFKDYLNCNPQAVAAPSPVTSPAPTRKGSSVYLKKSGVWTTYTDVSPKGEKILGMYTIIGGNAGFYVKYFGGNHLVVQMFKKGWQFPNGGVEVLFSIQFDDETSYPGTGNALMDGELALVEAPIRDPEVAGNFMNELMHADKMTITFDQGNERPWIVDMTGTRETGEAFNKAMEAMCNCTKSTQPYNTKPTAKNGDI